MTIHGAREASPMKGTPPSDLELMLYADGELDEERLAEIEAWLEGDRELTWYHRTDLGFAGRRPIPKRMS